MLAPFFNGHSRQRNVSSEILRYIYASRSSNCSLVPSIRSGGSSRYLASSKSGTMSNSIEATIHPREIHPIHEARSHTPLQAIRQHEDKNGKTGKKIQRAPVYIFFPPVYLASYFLYVRPSFSLSSSHYYG